MKNEKIQTVKINCPECKEANQINVVYSPQGRGATFTNPDGKKIDEQGFADCEKCKAQFVYKLAVNIECHTSKIKF